MDAPQLEAFERFWRAYPRKASKGDARKAWAKLQPDPVLQTRILESLAWQRDTEQWQRDGGQFIPYPATWLRAERWEDEPVTVQPSLMERTRTRAGRAVVAFDQAFAALEARKGGA